MTSLSKFIIFYLNIVRYFLTRSLELPLTLAYTSCIGEWHNIGMIGNKWWITVNLEFY